MYDAHKDRNIPLEDLKWGEEFEYLTMKCTSNGGYVMTTRGNEYIDQFNNSHLAREHGIKLMPEFGGWMLEAVPNEPYQSIIDAEELLSCERKI